MAFARPKQTAQQFLNSLRAVPLYKHHETPKTQTKLQNSGGHFMNAESYPVELP